MLGQVHVYSDVALLYSLTGFSNGGGFGTAAADAGDIDGDGFTDILVGAPTGGIGGTGRVYLYSGVDGTILRAFDGTGAGDLFGTSVAGAGDLNGDTVRDILVGAPYSDAGGNEAGRVYAYSGSDGALLFTMTGESAYDHFGLGLAGGSDLNSDGRSDIVVGAPDVQPCTVCPAYGRAYIFHTPQSPSGDYSATSAALTLGATNVGDYAFGTTVVYGNDISDDGVVELLVTSRFTDSGEAMGRVSVLSGATGALLDSETSDPEVDTSESGDPFPDIYAWGLPVRRILPGCLCVYQRSHRQV